MHMAGGVSDCDKGIMPWVGLMVYSDFWLEEELNPLLVLGVTGSLSNGGSGGSTGSSVGMMNIPWCSGVERNLGHCFGNQGGGRCADR